MIGKLVVITGLDGSGTSSIAEALCKKDPNGILFKTPDGPFGKVREFFDAEDLRIQHPSAHYLFYLAAVVYASDQIREKLKTKNVYCVRYLIDTVVSHRVASLDIELTYEGAGYSIKKPDLTLFINIDETIRQDRISARGKSELDKVLDNEDKRDHFLREFKALSNNFIEINNTSNFPETIKQAVSHIPWLNLL